MNTTTHSIALPAFFLGIDVGKIDLFCHLLAPEGSFSQRFDNTPHGIKCLQDWLLSLAPLDAVAACLEQTGFYGQAVASCLCDLDPCAIYIVNPRTIKAYGQRRLRRNKSDTADARLIAEFVQSEHSDLHPWTPQSPDCEELKALSRYADSLIQDNARLKTRCESVSLPAILRSLRRRIKAQEREIADIRSRINKIIAKNEDLRSQFNLLSSIPGLGEVTCHILLSEIPPIDLFNNARQLAAWAGLTPKHFVSGTSGRTRTPITKVGSSRLRRALFMPAMNARVFNPLLNTFADRLREAGKTPKQVIVAVMRKLLHQIYGILKSQTPYNPEKRGYVAA